MFLKAVAPVWIALPGMGLIVLKAVFPKLTNCPGTRPTVVTALFTAPGTLFTTWIAFDRAFLMALAPKFTVLSTAAGTALIVSTVTDTLLEVCQEGGGQEVGTWRTLGAS